MIDIRTGERLSRAAGKLPPTGITTGFRAIDEILYHRGWGKRELSVILGGAKAGKTTMLMEFGASAIAAGYNVLYVTLEVAANIIGERLDANISQRAMMELHLHPHEVRSKVKEFMKKAGKFILHEFPTGSMTVSDLRRLVERYKSRGIKFDLVIVDYADLMAPERYTDSNIENSKSVYVNLRGYAMQEDLAILTATQTNRDGYKAAVAKAEHVSEDFNKIRIADLVISINRTEEERASNQARLFFAASRNQAGNFTIRIEQDLDRMKGISKILGME
jgi:replicative DNA helicase